MRTRAFLTSALAAAVCVTPVALAPMLAAPSVAATPTVYGGIWTTDPGANTVREYAPSATGAAVATAVISGADTGLHAPSAVAVGSGGTVYVVNAGNDSITAYAPTANGDAAPIRTIIGARTGLSAPSGISLAAGQIWVTDPAANMVEAFTASDSGNVLPAETIAGPATGLDHPISVSVSFPFVSVLNTPAVGPASIGVYVPFDLVYGNVKPFSTMTGTKTTLLSPTTIAAAPDGETWVNDTANNSVTRVFPLFSGLLGGGPAPIKGSKTGLDDPIGLAVDASGDLLVANASSHSVGVFSDTAKGNAAPVRTITGVGTSTGSPAGIAVFGIRPGTPTNLHAVVHGNSAALSWKPPTVTGGGLIGYIVLKDAIGDSEDGGILESIGGSDELTTTKTSITVHHLKNGRPYFFSVLAFNGFGDSDPSNLARVLVDTVPTAPRRVTATAHGEGISVHWAAPKSDGGRPVTRYEVEYATCVPGAKHCAVSTRTVSASRHHAVISALRAGETYNVRVLAHNVAGNSAPSKDVKVTTNA